MMKKTFLTIAWGLFCATMVAQNNRTAIPISADLGAVLLNPDGTEQTVYPAHMVFQGQWCDMALWKAPFSINEYPMFRVTLQRGPEEDGWVQLFARNHESTGNWKGPYIPFKKNQTVLEGEFWDYDDTDHGGGYFENDPLCTWFAIQKANIGPERLELTVTEVVLINENEEEIVSHCVRNESWKPSPDWNEPDPVYDGLVRFDNKGTVGVYTSNGNEIQLNHRKGEIHRYTFRTAEPLPEGFTFFLMLDDGEDTSYEYPVPAGVTEYVTPDIDDSYKFAYLVYEGNYPMTVHFTEIFRDFIDPSSVNDAVTMQGVAHRDIYTASGLRRDYRGHGLNIVRDRMDDGSVRVKKEIR